MANREFPYFPMYVDDFCNDGKVEAMSTTAVGAYILILFKAWKEKAPGIVPDDDELLCKWARMNMREWLKIKPRVTSAFIGWQIDGKTFWKQKRMREEFKKLCKLSRVRSIAGKKGAKNKWDGKAIDLPMAKNGNIDPDPDINIPPNPPPAGGNGKSKSKRELRDGKMRRVKPPDPEREKRKCKTCGGHDYNRSVTQCGAQAWYCREHVKGQQDDEETAEA